MALTADQITAQNFKDFYAQILPYLNKGNGGTSDTPLGQVAFFDDLVAPYGWLVADGSTYNIADYPDLANQYERVHGSKNFYGGNGTTTFAVPNWQGEFLRASGTNSHTNQGSGAAVGVHQNSSAFPTFWVKGDGSQVYFRRNSATEDAGISNVDLEYNNNTSGTVGRANMSATASATSATVNYGTIRPTNTSLLLCIKAIPSSEMNTYSLTERRVGTWIDGKPLYEKTIVDTFPNTSADQTQANKYVPIGATVNEIISIDAILCAGTTWFPPFTYNDPSTGTVLYQRVLALDNTASSNVRNCVRLVNTASAVVDLPVRVTIQYTKTTD